MIAPFFINRTQFHQHPSRKTGILFLTELRCFLACSSFYGFRVLLHLKGSVCTDGRLCFIWRADAEINSI